MKARLACAALVAGSVAVLACNPDNALGGSVDALFPLSVSFTELRRNPEAFQVSYFNNRGHEIDLVAQVTLALEGVDFRPGQTIDLSGEYAPGHPRITIVHAAADEAQRVMPPIKMGDMVLEAGGNPWQVSRGNFSVGFIAGTEYGSGRTLYGSFSGLTLDAGFEPGDAG